MEYTLVREFTGASIDNPFDRKIILIKVKKRRGF